MSSFNLVTLLLGFPETKYKRKVARANPQSTQFAPAIQTEKGDEQASSDKRVHVSATPEMEPTSYVGRGRPSKSQFALWHSLDSSWKSHIFHDLLTPFRISLYPIILWTAFVVGGTININLFFVLTESEVLAAPPYNWTPSSVGFANFASTIGGILGLLTAGPLSDFVVRRAAKKNNGVREAEMRLPALIPYTLLMTLGVTLGGLAYQHHWPWPVILIFGYAGAGLSVTSIPVSHHPVRLDDSFLTQADNRGSLRRRLLSAHGRRDHGSGHCGQEHLRLRNELLAADAGGEARLADSSHGPVQLLDRATGAGDPGLFLR